MKSTVLILFSSILLFSCGNTEITEDNFTDIIEMKNPPVIEMEESEFDFGTVIEGTEIKRTFKFTNTGSGPLVIADINGSCGCTVAKNWPRQPVLSGESGTVDIAFNTEGREGDNLKYITITANTQPADTKIKLTGTVVGPDQN
jgi:hypothetical protein